MPAVLASVVLFAMGGAVAWITLPKALQFLLGVGGPDLQPLLSAGKYDVCKLLPAPARKESVEVSVTALPEPIAA